MWTKVVSTNRISYVEDASTLGIKPGEEPAGEWKCQSQACQAILPPFKRITASQHEDIPGWDSTCEHCKARHTILND